MKKGRGSSQEIIIDLTSLLDIIFILLAVIIFALIGRTNESKLAQKNAEYELNQAESLESKAKQDEIQAESKAKAYADLAETFSNIQNYVWQVSIVVPYDPNDYRKREIQIYTKEQEFITVGLTGSNVNGEYEDFEKELIDYIEKHKNEPVFISLNDKDHLILYRDEKRITEIIRKLQQDYKNVYIKNSSEEEHS
jgi:biopolymer transport protein ExbD